MQGGSNAGLLREIRTVLKRLPHLTMAWLKVKAHLKRPPESVHENLNEEMDSLAKSVHQSNMWQALSFAQLFDRAPVGLLVNQRLVTGDAGVALQRAYHAPQMKSELCKKHGWDDGQFELSIGIPLEQSTGSSKNRTASNSSKWHTVHFQ